jgi:Na+/melibiose symporter-like transporter
MIGSFLTGVLWDKYGSEIPFLISAIISLIITFTLLFIKTTPTS